MAHLIYDRDQFLAQWAVNQIPHIEDVDGLGPFRAVGVATGPDKTDRLMAVCVFHCYDEVARTAQITMAACDPRWATRGTIRDLLSFPFIQHKCNKVWTITPHTLERTIKLNERIGFKKEAVLRHQMGKGVHGVVCGMLWGEYKRKYLPNWNDGRDMVMSEAIH